MNHQFASPSGESLLGEAASIFREKPVFQRRDRHVVFVCGGSVKARSRSMRKRFLRYAPCDGRLGRFRFFLAETAMRDLTTYNEPHFINLAKFEALVADIADCILIFPESPGAIAEIGFFSNSKAAKKILVVNDINWQGDSFINLGPIDLVNEKSIFRSTILLDYKKKPLSFETVGNRLVDRLRTRNAKRFVCDYYDSLEGREKFYLIFELIRLFRIVDFAALKISIVKMFRGSVDDIELRQILSILCASNYVNRRGDEYEYFVARHVDPFLDYRYYDERKFHTIAMSHYSNHAPRLIEMLQGGQT
ncbi:MAG: hypothetical protein HND59_00735 [Pseudomonadota bacterium]|nr:MAG: hypothetical protein HND59_00735 [Pseudomonadota bacterium]